MTTIDELRRAAESIVRRDAVAQLDGWLAGTTAQAAEPPPLDGPDPFTPEAVALLREALPAGGDETQARVQLLLYRGLDSGTLDRAVRPALAAAASSAVAHVSYLIGEGGAAPWQGDEAWRACEEPELREALFSRLLATWAGSAPSYLAATAALRQAATGLGLVGADQLIATLARVEPDRLRASASGLLAATDGLLGQALRQACEAHALPPHAAHLPRLFGLPEMEHRFTPERMLPVAGSLLDGLGLPLAHARGLRVTDDPQPGPRPCRAFPVNLPREVRLVVHRAPGIRWAQHHLLALGQALHWLHGEPGPFPFRWPFGHRAVSDGFGLLLGSLLTHPGVLRDRGLPAPVAETLARVAQRSRLLHLRTMAALLARTPCGPEAAARPEEAYAEALGRARGIPVSEEEARAWPLRVEATYAAETLQSWLLAAALRRQLRQRLGDGWWHDPETAGIWIEWLKPGQRLSVSELCATQGQVPIEQALDPATLVEWLHGDE